MVLLLFFFIWPFGAWLYAVSKIRLRSSYVIFFLFSLLICWHMAPTGYTDFYDDFLGIKDQFDASATTSSEMRTMVVDFFTLSEDAPKEIYRLLLEWFVKLFTDNYHFYFLLCSIPVTLCMLPMVRRFTSDSRFKVSFIGLLTVAMFVFPRDIFTVQNARFATGLWVCLTFTILYYCNGRKWIYILPVLFSPVFHSGMWPYVALFVIALFIPRYRRGIEIVALCSIPFIFFDADLMSNFNVSILPPGIRAWVERGLSEEKYNKFILHEGRSGFWWVTAAFSYMMRVAYIIMTYLLIKKREYVEQNEEARNLYVFYLLLFAFVNFIQFVPILGERYYWFLRMFCVFMFFKAFYCVLPAYKKVLMFLLVACSWGILQRYGYVLNGALSVHTSIDLFYAPLPYLIGKGLFWS